tara:strand:+ start:123 stop:416 length:294 start_codon:yes stop_codon:yes gene_type:complete
MSIKRKKFTTAEKAKIALEAIKGEQSVAQISSKYGIHSTQINAWKRKALSHLPDAFNDKAEKAKESHQEEVALLYQQIGQLKVENDFLKKKSEVFCA